MNRKALVVLGASVIGLLAGPSSLQTAAMSRPPIEHSDLAFILFGSAFGLMFVLGIQGVRKDPGPFMLFWRLFAVGAVYVVATGVSAMTVSIISGVVAPYSFLFACMGVGMALGLTACRRVFASRFMQEPN